MKKSLFILLALVALIITACDNRGSGTVVEQPNEAESYKITSMIANPDQIFAGSQAYDTVISVNVKDMNDYAVPNHIVYFKVLPGGPGGSVDYQVATDSMGVAKATYSNDDANASGRAVIEARIADATATDTVGVKVIPSENNGVDEYQLQFENTTPIELTVQGGGGQETQSVSVVLYKNGTIYTDDDHSVKWLLPTAPDSTNINGVLESLGTNEEFAVVSPTLNGKATVNVNSGVESGTAEIYAFCDIERELQDGTIETIRVDARRSNISIFSGEPVEGFAVNFGEGATVSDNATTAGFWDIEIVAQIKDKWGNPILYGTAVSFSIVQAWDLNGNPQIDEENASVDWVSIVANSYIGNANAGGDSAAGLAYSKLIYDGTHSNDSIRVKVEVGSIESYKTLTLPMGELELQFESEVGHITTTTPINGEVPLFANLRDVQGNRIHNAHIYLISNWGFFTFSNYILQQETAVASTLPDLGAYHEIIEDGPFPEVINPGQIYTNVNGYAQGYWVAPAYQFLPPDDQGQPQDRQAVIRAVIYENDIEESVEVIFRSYAMPPAPTN